MVRKYVKKIRALVFVGQKTSKSKVYNYEQLERILTPYSELDEKAEESWWNRSWASSSTTTHNDDDKRGVSK